MEPESQIIRFEDDTIYYFIETDIDDNIEKRVNSAAVNLTLKYYNLKTGSEKELLKLNSVADSSTQSLIIKDRLYIPYHTLDSNNAIIMVDLKDGGTSPIYKWQGDMAFTYLYNLNDDIALFNISQIDGVAQYTIDLISPENSHNGRIIEKQFTDEGTIISSVCVDRGYIYTFENETYGGVTNYKIVKYNEKGETLKSTVLNLDDFLQPPQSDLPDEMYEDSIIDLYKIDDVIILTTLNQRIIIFKEADNSLTRIPIPTELYKEFPSGYRVLNASADKTNKMFFCNQFKDEKTIMIMNLDDYKFSYVDLPFKEQGLRRIHMDPDGNILIQETILENGATEYQYIKNENLNEVN